MTIETEKETFVSMCFRVGMRDVLMLDLSKRIGDFEPSLRRRDERKVATLQKPVLRNSFKIDLVQYSFTSFQERVISILGPVIGSCCTEAMLKRKAKPLGIIVDKPFN
ncbi:hypothetical protein CDAR_122531 [Caerostris darwini]|uniref:Uncharacterized protein n=1 Tax=Caerostris darwini TaxID=1538125 RepID=A0AAV4M9W7_9ARAC|nr:hypothetical protein CDAR_122531 [Caerostris darwini]